jgi:hypothetical protein
LRETVSQVRAEPEQAAAEALVVVHDVEAATLTRSAKAARDSPREAQRLGERTEPSLDPLDHVDRVAQLAQARRAEERVLVPQIEARQLDQAHTLDELRIGLPAPDLDVVAEITQRLAEQANVDALASRTWVPSVRQKADSERTLAWHG